MSDAELIDLLNDIEAGLTGWELDFLESVTKQVDAGRSLSPRQREIAERIYDEKGQT